jgi:cytochrome c peroxidase
MKDRRFQFILAICVGVSLAAAATAAPKPGGLAPIQQLGKDLFFDTNLSAPAG